MLDSYAIKVVSCHLLSHFGPKISDQMEGRLLSLIATTCLAYSQDEHQEVRAAACGTLGVLIMQPSFNLVAIFKLMLGSQVFE
jgi:hypothetical protein